MSTAALDYKTMSNAALFALAQQRLGKCNDWQVSFELHRRGGREIFRQATLWCRSPVRLERELGAHILGQLGWRKDHFRQQSIKLLIHMLDDSEPRVIASAAYALGHRSASEAVSKLVSLAGHRQVEVRRGVVSGLSGQSSDAAINALIQLSQDRAKEVRNWATFGLGDLIDTDSEEIRAALVQRLTDPYLDVRFEALKGLANRKHPQALAWTLDTLRDEKQLCAGHLDAAETLADARLRPDLLRIKADCLKDQTDPNGYFMHGLERAITACSTNDLS